MGDLCYYCDGTGERDFLSGARCLYCNRTGWRDEPDEEEDYDERDLERDELDREFNH